MLFSGRCIFFLIYFFYQAFVLSLIKCFRATISSRGWFYHGNTQKACLVGIILCIRDWEWADHRNKVDEVEGAWKRKGGYTHSRVVGAALRQPSCQFSTGTGMQVSLMVSWQRKVTVGPLSRSTWTLLWTVSTTEGGGVYGDRRPKEEGKEDIKTCEARTAERETIEESQAFNFKHI